MDNTTKYSLVRIFANDDSIAGVGFLVSDRHVLSCAHVVAAAIPGCKSTSQVKPTEKVKIDFPLSAPGSYLWLTVDYWLPVKVESGQPSSDEDIVILRINDEDTINYECQAVNLLPVDDFSSISFESFGFPNDSKKNQLKKGIPARGETRGEIAEGCVMIENTSTNSKGYFVEPGFSGAPIYDDKSVIGMVVRADKTHSIAYMLPSNILLKACFGHIGELLPELSEELVGLLKGISSRNWLSVYLRYNVDKTSRPPANVYLAVLDLLRLTDRQKGLSFICDLGQEFQCQLLVEWVKTRFPEDYPQIYTQITSKESEGAAKAKLLFQVQPLTFSEEFFELHYWIDFGTGYIKRSDIKPERQKLHEIVKMIQEKVEKYCSDYYLSYVELVLPRSKFSLDITNWKTQNGAIFLQYEAFVVLRCLDRFNARRKKLGHDNQPNKVLQEKKDILDINTKKDSDSLRLPIWQANSSKLKGVAKVQAGQLMYTLAQDQSRDTLFLEFKYNDKGLFVACNFAPQANQDSSVLSVALDYGAPLAIWFRELPGQDCYDKNTLFDMLRLETGVTFDELLEHLWKLQKEALQENSRDNPLYHLTILYDEYDNVPQ